MMKTFRITILAFAIGLTTGSNLSAQNTSTTDSLANQPYDDSMDSLLGKWHAEAAEAVELVPDTLVCDSTVLCSAIPDSVFIKRLSEIVSPFPFPFNDKVKACIDFYVRRKRDQMERMLGQSEYYFPQFEAVLDAKNIPLELKYLPIIESALYPTIRSRAGAVGLWQFMYYTGKRYNLEITSYVDERMDVTKSTEAAANFLSDLYNIYGDWHLVIAAYNCGPGNINKAIRRSGGKKDFWQIYPYLPRETKNYVPSFIAAAYAFNFYKDHNIMPRPSLAPTATDTIMVNKLLHFDQIAAVLGISISQIKELNPQYRRDVIPGSAKKSYALRLPFDQALAFASLEDSIYKTNRTKYFNNEQLVVNPASPMGYDPEVPANSTKIYHTVRSGDTPGGIADKYHVSLTNLKYWNDIHRNMIRVGQRLVIYVPKGKAAQYTASTATTPVTSPASQTAAQASATTEKTDVVNVLPSLVAPNTDYIYYTVRSGDNLWSIAKKFPGVSNDDIMALNNLPNGKLSIGQKLKIPKT